MKKNKPVFKLALGIILLIGITILTNCTKEGPQGMAGENGMDGTETCTDCHNASETVKSVMSQYYMSVHASGHNVDRNYSPCGGCHTSMGFRSRIEGNPMSVVNNPAPINCRTCHPIHESYSVNDFAVRTNEAVTLDVGGVVYDYGNSNLCANCHQARVVDPLPGTSTTDSVTIRSPYYGPHHATQASMIKAEGPVNISGSMAYVNSVHTTQVTEGCITCHMSPSQGVVAGGHQMGMKYEYHGSDAFLYTGCSTTDCHASVDDVEALHEAGRTEIIELEEQLLSLLKQKNLLNSSGLVPTPLKVSELEAAAIYNYKFVEGDLSHGTHNYRYTKALLTNTIESLQ